MTNIFGKQNGIDLKYLAKCTRCSFEMNAAPFVPVVGGGADPRLLRYIGALKDHVEKHHPDIGMQIGAYSCFLIAAAFKLEDPLLLQMQSDLRHGLHRMTARTKVTDEQLELRATQIAAKLNLDEETRGAIEFVFKDLRDALIEQGEYAPKQPSTVPVTA